MYGWGGLGVNVFLWVYVCVCMWQVVCRVRPMTGLDSSLDSQNPGGGTVRVVGPVKPYGIGLELCAPRSAMRSTVAALQGNPGLSDRCNLFMCVLLPKRTLP